MNITYRIDYNNKNTMNINYRIHNQIIQYL